MHVVQRHGRDLRFECNIKLVYFGCLQLLQRTAAEGRLNMDPQKLLVTLQGPLADLLLLSPGRACLDPLIDPCLKFHLIRLDVLARVARSDQRAQFLAGF